MYDAEITRLSVEKASRALGRPLVYHTDAYVAGCIAHFEDLLDEDSGQLKRALAIDEQRFIQNERMLCALDFRYWAGRYARIVDWEKKEVPFIPNIGQNMIIDIWAEHERGAIAIMLQQLKARQLGITTVNQMAVTHRFQFLRRTNAVVASADPKKTVEMGQMIKFCLDAQPWWLLPSSPRDKVEKGITVEYADLDSRLSIQAGNQFHGVARGATPNVGQLSEVSSWNNAEDDIDASFIRAVHETPDVFVSLESTALGRANWWAESWEIVKEDWPRGRSRLRPVFLPWFVGTDIYPTKTDLRTRPVPHDWVPSDRTIAHAERARAYVKVNPLLFKYLAKEDPDWQMPRAQMWFYEIERDTAQRKKTLNKFLSEMPADDQEAFQNTGLSVIDQDVILTYRDLVKQPLGVYAIIGPGIHQTQCPPRHEWLTGPKAPPAITVRVSSLLRSPETYQFIPLRFEGYSGYDPMFKLFIYEWPEDGQTYGIGVDTSDGIGEDWSVLEGYRKANAFQRHAQTFEFASPYIKADQLWPMTLALSVFYSVVSPMSGNRSQCRVCVECRGNGEIVQHELQKRGWWNFHPWKKYDNRKRVQDNQVHKVGVFTNVWFRSMMMDKLLTLIDEESLDIGSPWFVSEMSSLERDVDELSARAAYNTHDDRIMALGFPLFSLTVDDLATKSFRKPSPNYFPEDAGEPDLVGYPTWTPGFQGSDLPGAAVLPVISRRGQQSRLAGLRNGLRIGKGW